MNKKYILKKGIFEIYSKLCGAKLRHQPNSPVVSHFTAEFIIVHLPKTKHLPKIGTSSEDRIASCCSALLESSSLSTYLLNPLWAGWRLRIPQRFSTRLYELPLLGSSLSSILCFSALFQRDYFSCKETWSRTVESEKKEFIKRSSFINK
jgi:hypothetical protein